jgi:hypothetical protein
MLEHANRPDNKNKSEENNVILPAIASTCMLS